jgi:hypothetical protein
LLEPDILESFIQANPVKLGDSYVKKIKGFKKKRQKVLKKLEKKNLFSRSTV